MRKKHILPALKTLYRMIQYSFYTQFWKWIQVLFLCSESVLDKMVKFNVLENNQRLMIPLGIYPHQLSESTNSFFKSFSTYYILSSLLFTMIIPALTFMCKNRTSNVNLVIATILVAVAGIQSFGLFFNTGLKMKAVKQLHLKLQGIVDEGTPNEPVSIKIFQ